MSLGEVLDGLGVEADLEDGDLVSSAVVVMSVFREGNSAPTLAIANSAGLGWIEQSGLLRLAERISSDPSPCDDEEG